MSVISLKNKEEFNNIISQNNYVVFDFWAEWCKPCLDFLPTLEYFANIYQNLITFVKINIDEFQDITSKYDLFVFPSFLFFKNHKLWNKYSTNLDKIRFSEIINKFYP